MAIRSIWELLLLALGSNPGNTGTIPGPKCGGKQKKGRNVSISGIG